MKNLYLLLTTIVVTSCAINNPLDTYSEQEQESNMHRTRSMDTSMQLDSLRALSMLQSNKNIILFNSLCLKDGKYVLGLSLESARELGISEELYVDFISSIDDLNNSL